MVSRKTVVNRLNAEREDIATRREELYNDMTAPDFQGLHVDDQGLMKDQYNLMGTLLDVMNKRIERAKG